MSVVALDRLSNGLMIALAAVVVLALWRWQVVEAPAYIGRGNWIVTHAQMLTLAAAWATLMVATVTAIITGSIWVYNEHTAIAKLQEQMTMVAQQSTVSELKTQVTHVEHQNSKMESQIDKLYCAQAGNPKIPACEDAQGSK